MVTAGILLFKENSHDRPGNRTRDLMISSQRPWPLDHEAGLFLNSKYQFITKNLTDSSGHVGYVFLGSNSKVGPSFIAKLSVSGKILMIVKIFSPLLRVKNSALLINLGHPLLQN